MKDLLINTWYVATPLHALPDDKPLRVRILGCDLVLFRDTGGNVACLSDVCCHRGGSLGEKPLDAGCVQCAYHGWKYDGAGRCTAIPSLGPDAKIPKRARVDAYPVEVKYGLVWVFLGDLPADERPPVPGWLDEFLNKEDEYWLMHYQYDLSGINWMRAVENSLDSTHLAHVHPMFGGRLNPEMAGIEINPMPWGACTGILMPIANDAAKPGYLQDVLDKDRKPLGVQLEFSMAGLAVVIRQHLAPGTSQYLLTVKTPVDEDNTLTFGVQMRTYMRGAEHDAKIRSSLERALGEDYGAVSRVKPHYTPESSARELLVPGDSLEMEFRRHVERWSARGWAIDVDTRKAQEQSQVFVIPSPARRTDPQGWVHEAVPLRAPAKPAGVQALSG